MNEKVVKVPYEHFDADQLAALKSDEILPSKESLEKARLTDVIRPCPSTILVFKGAGVLGSAYPGLLLELEKQHRLEGITTVAGTSSGGLVAILVALGYSSAEIKKIIFELKFDKLLDNPNTTPWQKFINYLKGNLDPGTVLMKKLEGYIFDKLNTPEVLEKLNIKNPEDIKKITFAQLKALGKKDLYLTGTCTTTNNGATKGVHYFSAEHTPDMPIADAGRSTACHPFVYTPFIYKDNKYTDGAISMPFPMFFFDKQRFVPQGYKLNEDGSNPSVLGIAIETKYHIKKQWNRNTKRSFKKWLSHMFYECIVRPLAFFGLYERKHDHVREKHPTQIIQSYDAGVHLLDFTINDALKTTLMGYAELETRRYYRNYHAFDAYIADETRPKEQRYTFKNFENFQQKYQKYETPTPENQLQLENIIRYELTPAIKRYQDRIKAGEQSIELTQGLGVYETELQIANKVLTKIKAA